MSPVVVDEAFIVAAAFGPEITGDKPNSDPIGPELPLFYSLHRAPRAEQANEFGHMLTAWDRKPVRDLATIRVQEGPVKRDRQLALAIIQLKEHLQEALSHQSVLIDSSDICTSGAPCGCIQCKHLREWAVLLQRASDLGRDQDK